VQYARIFPVPCGMGVAQTAHATALARFASARARRRAIYASFIHRCEQYLPWGWSRLLLKTSPHTVQFLSE